MKRWTKLIRRIIEAIFCGYVMFCILAYTFPRYFYYHPHNETPSIEEARNSGYPAEKVEYKSADNTPLYAWMTPSKNKQKKPANHPKDEPFDETPPFDIALKKT